MSLDAIVSGFSIEDVDKSSSLNDQISEWAYSKLSEIKNFDHLLIEIKFGQVLNKKTKSRLISNGLGIINERWKTRFEMNIDKPSYDEIKKYLDKLDLSCSHSVTSDTIYDCGFNGGKVRITKDGKDESSYEKKRIGDLLITFPNCKYDLKLAFSSSTPNPNTRITTIKRLNRPELIRKKDRLCWADSDKGIRYEATKVDSTRKDTTVGYECELDLKPSSIFDLIDKEDELKIRIQSYFNQAVAINNALSK